MRYGLLVLLALVLWGCTDTPQAPSLDQPQTLRAAASRTDFTWTCTGLACDFNATGGGTVQWRDWFFGDGSPMYEGYRNVDTAQHTYAAPGSYTVKLYIFYRTSLSYESVSHVVTIP